MGLSDGVGRLRPYVEQLLDDEEVQANIRRAVGASRGAYVRSRSKKHKSTALQDSVVQQRVREAARSLRSVATAVGDAPQRKRREQRRKVAVGALAAGAVIAVAAVAGPKLGGSLGGGQEEGSAA